MQSPEPQLRFGALLSLRGLLPQRKETPIRAGWRP